MTWVGSGEKEGESFHVCFSAAQCWRGTVAEQGSAWSASIYIYIYIYIYLKKLTIEANLYSTINKVKVAGFFIPKTHMAFRLILFSELTSGK